MPARLLALSVLAGLSANAAAPAAAQQPRQPTEKWVVNFADAQCIASRNYGTREQPLLLALKAPPLGDTMQVSVVRPGKGRSHAEQFGAAIAFDGNSPVETTMAAFGLNDLGQRVYRIRVPGEAFQPARTARTVRISAEQELDETFALDGMQPLMNVLDQCVADLRKVWNVSEGGAANASVSTGARGNLAALINSYDYPEVAVLDDSSGTVTVAVLIDETGKVADCTIAGTSGSAALDARTCQVIEERARFEPAVDRGGQPAKSFVVQRVSWSIPG